MSTHYTTDGEALTAAGDVMIDQASGPQPRTIDPRWLESEMGKAIRVRSIAFGSAPTRPDLIAAAREAQTILPAGHPLRRLIDAAAALEG